jgi:CheY-like chemotaxis protein
MLVLEDNQHMRAIIMTILGGVGIKNVRESPDSLSAIRIMREHPVDIALVDFQLSGMDGVEFTRQVRRSPVSPDPFLPVIMITGHSERARVEEARDAGVTEFVAKPLTARALLARIEAVIFRPRPFIRCTTFFGPDRRRRNDPEYQGPMRRSTDRRAQAELDDDFILTPVAPAQNRR